MQLKNLLPATAVLFSQAVAPTHAQRPDDACIAASALLYANPNQWPSFVLQANFGEDDCAPGGTCRVVFDYSYSYRRSKPTITKLISFAHDRYGQHSGEWRLPDFEANRPLTTGCSGTVITHVSEAEKTAPFLFEWKVPRYLDGSEKIQALVEYDGREEVVVPLRIPFDEWNDYVIPAANPNIGGEEYQTFAVTSQAWTLGSTTGTIEATTTSTSSSGSMTSTASDGTGTPSSADAQARATTSSSTVTPDGAASTPGTESEFSISSAAGSTGGPDAASTSTQQLQTADGASDSTEQVSSTTVSTATSSQNAGASAETSVAEEATATATDGETATATDSNTAQIAGSEGDESSDSNTESSAAPEPVTSDQASPEAPTDEATSNSSVILTATVARPSPSTNTASEEPEVTEEAESTTSTASATSDGSDGSDGPNGPVVLTATRASPATPTNTTTGNAELQSEAGLPIAVIVGLCLGIPTLLLVGMIVARQKRKA